MTRFFATLRLTGFILFLVATSAFAAPATGLMADTSIWSADDVSHGYGFPDVHPNKKGTLTLDADALSFAGPSAHGSISRGSISAVSVGNDRVELWGVRGRILRMAIPEGGGLAAAAFMHHRVGMLTVEFRDQRQGIHYAVFYLPAAEADHALAAFAASAPAPAAPVAAGCGHQPVEPGSILVDAPSWQGVEVPAAYKGLIYEHMIDRLRRAKGVSRVYRSGEQQTVCPQYQIQLSIKSFKPGNQVVRASTGPIGMLASPTQIAFEAHFKDLYGTLDVEEQVHSSVRTESESTTVADKLAKALTKHYLDAVKQYPAPKAPFTPAAPTVQQASR